MKIKALFNLGTTFARIYNIGSRSSILSTIFLTTMFDLLYVPNFMKIEAHLNFGTTYAQINNWLVKVVNSKYCILN